MTFEREMNEWLLIKTWRHSRQLSTERYAVLIY